MSMKESEWLNEISEALFGYREAPEDEILSRIRSLVEIEKEAKTMKGRARLSAAVQALKDVLENIEE